MNCKPGDLAYVVGAGPRYGLVLRILKRSSWNGLTMPNGLVEEGVVWETDKFLLPLNGKGSPHNFMLDRQLRPIRDPGDDAVDESKAWLPPVPLPTINPELIPSKEKA